jgi:hypothetical protein
MAGGMRKRQGVGSLADRVGATAGEPSPAPVSLKHCWVVDEHGRLPALLLEWRRTASGFQGRVIRPVREPDGWVVVEEWLPAAMLEPAGTLGER